MPSEVKNRKIKGLSDLRTMAGQAAYLNETHKVYMRIAILEIEKVRRHIEHSHISRRRQLLDKRFREIDNEKRWLLEAMSTRDSTLKELRPAREERVTAQQVACRAAEETKRKASEQKKQRQIADAEDQRRRETLAARKRRGPLQPKQGFRLRY